MSRVHPVEQHAGRLGHEYRGPLASLLEIPVRAVVHVTLLQLVVVTESRALVGLEAQSETVGEAKVLADVRRLSVQKHVLVPLLREIRTQVTDPDAVVSHAENVYLVHVHEIAP